MKREIAISYCGMTIAGTVESPDARPTTIFGRDDRDMLVIRALRPGDGLLMTRHWREIAAEPELIDGILG